jgi:hypothetical protein
MAAFAKSWRQQCAEPFLLASEGYFKSTWGGRNLDRPRLARLLRCT